MANVVTDPKAASRPRAARLRQARPAADLQAERRRVRLRHEVEAALLHEGRQRLLSAAGAVGRDARVWRAYMVQPNTDWWVPHYPADNMKRPTGPLCDGCHSVNYNVADQDRDGMERRVREVPRPRQRTRRRPSPANIVNPARLDLRAGERHVHPVSFAGTAADQSDRGPVLRLAGRLSSGRQPQGLLEARGAQARRDQFTHFADGTAHKNRMQGNDFVQSAMYTRGVTCFSCHDVARHRQQRGPAQARARSSA